MLPGDVDKEKITEIEEVADQAFYMEPTFDLKSVPLTYSGSTREAKLSTIVGIQEKPRYTSTTDTTRLLSIANHSKSALDLVPRVLHGGDEGCSDKPMMHRPAHEITLAELFNYFVQLDLSLRWEPLRTYATFLDECIRYCVACYRPDSDLVGITCEKSYVLRKFGSSYGHSVAQAVERRLSIVKPNSGKHRHTTRKRGHQVAQDDRTEEVATSSSYLLTDGDQTPTPDLLGFIPEEFYDAWNCSTSSASCASVVTLNVVKGSNRLRLYATDYVSQATIEDRLAHIDHIKVQVPAAQRKAQGDVAASRMIQQDAYRDYARWSQMCPTALSESLRIYVDEEKVVVQWRLSQLMISIRHCRKVIGLLGLHKQVYNYVFNQTMNRFGRQVTSLERLLRSLAFWVYTRQSYPVETFRSTIPPKGFLETASSANDDDNLDDISVLMNLVDSYT